MGGWGWDSGGPGLPILGSVVLGSGGPGEVAGGGGHLEACGVSDCSSKYHHPQCTHGQPASRP